MFRDELKFEKVLWKVEISVYILAKLVNSCNSHTYFFLSQVLLSVFVSFALKAD